MSENGDENGGGRSNPKLFTGKPMAQMHKVYISGTIGDPEDYVECFEVIRNAGELDIVYIHINSEGGNVFTAIQFLRAIGETSARVIASVEGLCISAATLIFMAATDHEITKHSVFMFHNYSNKVEGKGGELFDHVMHMRPWGENMLRDVYDKFLTEDEIRIILDGKDLYMGSEEVSKRLEKRNAALQKMARAKLPKKEKKVVEPVV